MPFLDLKMRSRIPQPFRSWLFKIYPGRWTAEEVAEIYRRAALRKAEIDRIID